MSWMTAVGSVSAMTRVPTVSPSRMTVTRSPTEKISSMRWEMKMMLRPSAFRSLRISKNRSAWALSRAEVGSSKIRIGASVASVFMISTSWR